jgi:hypothetical protein
MISARVTGSDTTTFNPSLEIPHSLMYDKYIISDIRCICLFRASKTGIVSI